MIAEPSSTSVTGEPLVGTGARLVAAALVLVGGLVHLQLYFDGYRDIPDANLGRSFIANGVASIVVAIALVLRRDAIVRLAGIGVTIGTLGAFALSRTDRGVFGLVEEGLNPSPQAAIALFTELGALALLAITFIPAIGAGRRVAAPVGIVTAAAAVALSLGLAALWARSADSSAPVEAAPDASGVAIVDFAFAPDVLTVPTGSTVTWSNADGFAHTVAATDASFVSDSLTTGATFQHTFDTAGTFTYLCGIHPSMAGTVIVE